MTTHPTRSILVPVDFGEASARAVEVGGTLARHWPARLQLMHAEALEAPAYFTHDQIEALAAQRRQLHAQAEAYLSRFGRQHTSAAFTTAIERQAPAPAILEHAAGVDLVVMGTHGRHGPSLWWLGSVAERVLPHISTPLLVVHAADDLQSVFSRVGVHAEPQAAGDGALALARELAAPFGGCVSDHRGTVLPEPAPDATLVVVAVPRAGDRLTRSRIGLSRLRTRSGSVLFVPE